jgi:hypothetical protein
MTTRPRNPPTTVRVRRSALCHPAQSALEFEEGDRLVRGISFRSSSKLRVNQVHRFSLTLIHKSDLDDVGLAESETSLLGNVKLLQQKKEKNKLYVAVIRIS